MELFISPDKCLLQKSAVQQLPPFTMALRKIICYDESKFGKFDDINNDQAFVKVELKSHLI